MAVTSRTQHLISGPLWKGVSGAYTIASSSVSARKLRFFTQDKLMAFVGNADSTPAYALYVSSNYGASWTEATMPTDCDGCLDITEAGGTYWGLFFEASPYVLHIASSVDLTSWTSVWTDPVGGSVGYNIAASGQMVAATILDFMGGCYSIVVSTDGGATFEVQFIPPYTLGGGSDHPLIQAGTNRVVVSMVGEPVSDIAHTIYAFGKGGDAANGGQYQTQTSGITGDVFISGSHGAGTIGFYSAYREGSGVTHRICWAPSPVIPPVFTDTLYQAPEAVGDLLLLTIAVSEGTVVSVSDTEGHTWELIETKSDTDAWGSWEMKTFRSFALVDTVFDITATCTGVSSTMSGVLHSFHGLTGTIVDSAIEANPTIPVVTFNFPGTADDFVWGLTDDDFYLPVDVSAYLFS